MKPTWMGSVPMVQIPHHEALQNQAKHYAAGDPRSEPLSE